MSRRIGIIDLGSNSARLIIVEIYENKAYNLVYHQKETIRLSQGADKNQQLQPEAVIRGLLLLQEFAHVCKLQRTDEIIAVGTAAMRNARNGKEFAELIKSKTGIDIKIISGEAEANLGYIGVINTIDIQDAVLFDLGGGSMELTLIKNRKAENFISLPFGAVTLTERFSLQNKVSGAQLVSLEAFIKQQLSKVTWLKNLNVPLVGIGGTARGIAKMEQKRKEYPILKLHNYRTSSIAFSSLWDDVKVMSCDQRRKIPGLSNDRADIIVAGLAVVKNLFEEIQSDQLIVSSCGVREGLFLQYYSSQEGQSEISSNPLVQSTHNALLSYNGDTTHAYHVAALAEMLFADWQQILGLQSEDKRLLYVAAVLHDIGISVNYYDHARHSAYLVENARLFGLSHREQIMTSLIVGWHHTSSAKHTFNKIYNEFLDEGNWQTARKLALVLAIAESLDTTQMKLVEKVTTAFTNKKVQLTLTTEDVIPLELQAARKHCKWFKKETGLELVIGQ